MMETRADPSREAAFGSDYDKRSLAAVRSGLVLGAVLYALFAVLDVSMLPETWRSAHFIRFAIVIPVCITVFVATFVARARRYLQLMVSIMVITAGFGIVAMITVANEVEPGFRYYYAGLLLVLPFSFTLVRLRFIPTALCCLSIVVAYALVAIFDQGLLSEGLLRGSGPVFLNNSFFLISAAIITLMGSYVLENYARKDFLRRNELADALDELQATQTQLIQAERTNAVVGVVSGLLHELNTPLGVIASASDVIQRGAHRLEEQRPQSASSKEEAHYDEARTRKKTLAMIDLNAAVLREAADRVRHSLELLKRFTHLDQAERGECDVNEALEDCVALLAHEAAMRIDWIRKFAELPPIQCRPSEINQLFMNLLKNAVAAIPEEGRIEIRTSARDGSVSIEIADTGVGIPEERLGDLFVPGFNRDRTRVKLGMGLVTSYHVVHGHGGSIQIESTVGKGTCVSVTLPVKPDLGLPGRKV